MKLRGSSINNFFVIVVTGDSGGLFNAEKLKKPQAKTNVGSAITLSWRPDIW
jgi:hypothetical protein